MPKRKKPKMFRISFKPARCKKWWPRRGRHAQLVGVINGGYGWAVGQGDPVQEKQIEPIKEAIRWDYGPKTIFVVEDA